MTMPDWLEPGEPAWLVEHNDNSDVGVAVKWFKSHEELTAYRRSLPPIPEGNEDHPAPESYDLRAFKVIRLALIEYGDRGEA